MTNTSKPRVSPRISTINILYHLARVTFPRPAKAQRGVRKTKIPLEARERIKPYVENMTNWQRHQWARGLAGAGQYSVDPRRLLFHVCFRKPPLKPLPPADGQARIDAWIDRRLATRIGKGGPRSFAGIPLDGTRSIDSHALMRAYKATKDFLARQRRRIMARASRRLQGG